MSRWFALFTVVLAAGCQTMTTISRERIAEIVASPDRSAADRANDQRRRPEPMLDSEVMMASPTSALVDTCVPPQNSQLQSPTQTTRTR